MLSLRNSSLVRFEKPRPTPFTSESPFPIVLAKRISSFFTCSGEPSFSCSSLNMITISPRFAEETSEVNVAIVSNPERKFSNFSKASFICLIVAPCGILMVKVNRVFWLSVVFRLCSHVSPPPSMNKRSDPPKVLSIYGLMVR